MKRRDWFARAIGLLALAKAFHSPVLGALAVIAALWSLLDFMFPDEVRRG